MEKKSEIKKKGNKNKHGRGGRGRKKETANWSAYLYGGIKYRPDFDHTAEPAF